MSSATNQSRLEAALKIEDEFLEFAEEVKRKNAEKRKLEPESTDPPPAAKTKTYVDPLDNLLRFLDTVVAFQKQNRSLQKRIEYLEQKNNVHSLIMTSALLTQNTCTCKCKQQQQSGNYTLMHDASTTAVVSEDEELKLRSLNRRRRSSSGSRTWNRVKDALRKTSSCGNEQKQQQRLGKRSSRHSEDGTSDNSWSDLNLAKTSTTTTHHYDPYAELDSSAVGPHILIDDLGAAVKRSSSYTQVSDTLLSAGGTPKFMQRRHSLTSISGKSSPTSEESKKQQKTPWNMVKSIIGSGTAAGKSDHISGVKSTKKPHVKKPSLIEIAMEEDPFLGIWMGPPEKLLPDPPGPTAVRSKSYEVPASKHAEVVAQTKIERGVSYSPKISGTSARVIDPTGTGSGTSKSTSFEGSKWNKVRNAFLSRDDQSQQSHSQSNPVTLDESGSLGSMSIPSSPMRNSDLFFSDLDPNSPNMPGMSPTGEKESSGSRSSGDWHNIQGEIQQSYNQLQRQLSQEFHRKMQSWEKEKQASKESPGSPALNRSVVQANSAASDLMAKSNFPPEFKKKYEQWQKIKDEPGGAAASTSGGKSAEKSPTSPATEKKIRGRPLQQQTIQEQDLKPEFRLKVAEWEVRKAMAGTSKKNVDEIRQLMPEDFNKKLKEWEQKKQAPSGTVSPLMDEKSKTDRASRGRSLDKTGKPTMEAPMSPSRSKSSHEIGIAWLEKELQKLHKEKQQLEQEKAKHLDKQYRLEKIKSAMGKQHEEITVKTSKGEEFKFAGISEKFTKKLFEWEEQRGIAPESSTIALINSNLQSLKETNADESGKLEALALKRSRSEGSIIDPADLAGAGAGAKSMGGSEGNLSTCSLQSSKTKKSNDLDLVKDDNKPDITDEVKEIQRQQCLSRHDSIRTQANIQLLDEKIHLIGSIKAHREHCQHIESTLQSLEDQAVRLPQVPQEMLSTIKELRKDMLSSFHYPSNSNLTSIQVCSSHSHSESDLSCCGDLNIIGGASGAGTRFGGGQQSNSNSTSSSHSMSRYGSESPLRSLMPDYQTYELLKEQECGIIEEQNSGEDEMEDSLDPQHLSHQLSTPSEYRKRFPGLVGKQRRPSSDNISTPTSARSRSRSSSLLSSDYIPEEEEVEEGEGGSSRHHHTNQPSAMKPSKSQGVSKPLDPVGSSSRRTSSSSQFSSSGNSSTNIDRLYKLVHELKEEDLSNHKRKIAEKKAEESELKKDHVTAGSEMCTPPRKSSTDDTSLSSNTAEPPVKPANTGTKPKTPSTTKKTLDLERVLVPTTTQIINAIPNFEGVSQTIKMEQQGLGFKKAQSPVVELLANASLDLVLATDPTKKRSHRQSDIVVSKSKDPGMALALELERSNSEPRANLTDDPQNPMMENKKLSIADQMKKAREEFFLGGDLNKLSPASSARSSVDKTVDPVTESPSNVKRHVQKFGGAKDAKSGNKVGSVGLAGTTTKSGFQYIPGSPSPTPILVRDEDVQVQSMPPLSPLGESPITPTNISRHGSWSCPPSPKSTSKEGSVELERTRKVGTAGTVPTTTEKSQPNA